MSDKHERPPESDEIELLLPWLANRRLTDAETARVEAAIDSDLELGRRYGLVRDELDATVQINEALGAPSRAAAARLFARIDAEAPRSLSRLAPGAILRRLRASAATLVSLPRPWLAATAAIVIVMQAGGLAYLASRSAPATYQTASGPQKPAEPGRLALVGFVPGTTLGDIMHLLESNHVSIVDGPQGGLFTIRVGNETMSQDAADRIMAKLRDASAAVSFVAPKE